MTRIRLLMIGAAAVWLSAVVATCARGETVEGSRITVIDGDTVDLSTGERIRIWNIDTPELSGKCERERDVARQAKQRLIRLLSGRAVSVERCEPATAPGNTSGRERCRDRHGRTLARLVTAEGDVGRILVTEGLATVWPVRGEWCKP